jgi:hypothetical protein
MTTSDAPADDPAALEAMLAHQDDLQKRLQAFEDMVAAEEQAAERTRQVEIENLTLAVSSAEKLGLTGDDISAAEELLRQLRAADELDAGSTHLDSQTADAAMHGADLETRHTGSLQVVQDQTQSVALGVGDAFQLVLPANPEDGFIYRLRDAEYDHRVIGVIESKEKVVSETEGLVKVSWKVIGLAGGTTDFVIEFGVPWQGMEPLVYIEVTVDGPPPPARGREDDNAAGDALGPTATATAARRAAAASVSGAAAAAAASVSGAAAAMTAASDEALEALEAEALEAEAASDAVLAQQDAQLEELKRQLADAQARKAAMVSQPGGGGGGGGGGSMTPRESPSEGNEAAAAVAADPPVRSPATWSTGELCSWLSTAMKLGDVSAAAEAEEVDGATAVEMDNDAWKELGASALKAAKIVAGLKKLG